MACVSRIVMYIQWTKYVVNVLLVPLYISICRFMIVAHNLIISDIDIFGITQAYILCMCK